MKKMGTRKRLIEDFIIPALNDDKYPGKMFWLNKDQGIFSIYWSHKNAAKWQSDDTIVFQDWDRMKGHYKPECKNYHMSAKQRFRAALYKLKNYVIQLEKYQKCFRDYQLRFYRGGVKKLDENALKSKVKGSKKTNQGPLRPSVICENTSYIAKSSSEVQTPKSPSPVIVYKSQDETIQEYQEAMALMAINRAKQSQIAQNSRKCPREVHEASILRENSSTPRMPHIAPQQAPVYSSFKCGPLRQHTLHVCPDIFVSPIYNGPENMPQTKDSMESTMYQTDGILNLSLRSDSDVSR